MLNKRKKAREWAKHCVEMQNELNENNWKRYGWYVGSGNEIDYSENPEEYKKYRNNPMGV